MRRRQRGHAPAFIGVPIPHRWRGEAARARMIAMTLFHPWMFRRDEADAYVPHAWELRPHNMTWEEAMTT